MNHITFFLILVAAYFFYFTIMILMDAAKFSRSAVVTSAGTKQDFIVPQVQQAPIKVVIAKSSDQDLPQLDVAEDDDKVEPTPADQKLTNAGTNVFDAIGMETINEEDVIEVDGPALNFMLS